MKTNTKNWTAKPENEKKVNPGATKIHNLLIVDESGSMSSLYLAAISGMNETLESIRNLASECPQQAQEVTLVTFDSSRYNKIFDSVPAAETREITRNDYRPNACTPLYDAMGKALTELEPNVKEKEAVVVTVITDGYENASCEFSLSDIRALVERLEKQGWIFTYIGANQVSAKVGASMGIRDTMDFIAHPDEMKKMWMRKNISNRKFVHESRHADFDACCYERGNFFGPESEWEEEEKKQDNNN